MHGYQTADRYATESSRLAIEVFQRVSVVDTLLGQLSAASANLNDRLDVGLEFSMQVSEISPWEGVVVSGRYQAFDSRSIERRVKGYNPYLGDGTICFRFECDNNTKQKIARRVLDHLRPVLEYQLKVENLERVSLERLGGKGRGKWTWLCYWTDEATVADMSYRSRFPSSDSGFFDDLRVLLSRVQSRPSLDLPREIHLGYDKLAYIYRTSDELLMLGVTDTETHDRDVCIKTKLTIAEREVVYALLNYQTDEEIAKALGVSRRAVQRRLSNIYAKLGYENRKVLLSNIR